MATTSTTPLQHLLTNIIDFLIANPAATNNDLGGFIIGKYKFSPEQVLNFFTVLGATLENTGITDGVLIDDMKVTVSNIGEAKAKALVGLVAEGIRQDPTLQDEILTLRKWAMGEKIIEINADIAELEAAILTATGAVLDALNSWKEYQNNELLLFIERESNL